MSAAIRTETQLPAGPAAAAVLLEPILSQVAGAGAEPLSLTIDYGAAGAAGLAVVVEVAIDRTTRTLVFIHAEVLGAADRVVIASGTAIFRRPIEGQAGA